MAAALEKWFAAHQRDLPWRRRGRSVQNRAYRCLVAEYMLHQTQVRRVLDYFDRFIARFADVQSLAAAPEQEVLALWQGLGYYRRARYLHAAAKIIVGEHGGRVPRQVESLRQLPGIGRYTAGAIASIAFGVKAPIVDGNVQRLLARWFEIGGERSSREVEQEVWRLAEALVAASRDPGAFNQAMMELGSTICLPRGAKCDACPAAKWCRARANGTIERYPPVRERRETPVIHAASVVVQRGERVLLAQRPARGPWAGMWQCPTRESTDRVDAKAISRFVKHEYGLEVVLDEAAGTFTHQTSHRRVEFDVWVARSVKGRARGARWVALPDLEQFPLSNAQKRVLDLAGALPFAEPSGRG